MRRIVLTVLLSGLALSCSAGDADPLCSGRVSTAEYVLRFGQGLANFDDSASLSLEADSLSVLDVLLAGRGADGGDRKAAEDLSAKVAAFIASMNSHDWLISAALDDPKAVANADALATEDSLRQANTVEALVLQKCPSVPTLAAPQASYDTLPLPSQPAPDETVPPAAPPDDDSQARALGTIIGESFGLTMTPEQVLCVGRALTEVVDATQAQSGPGQYTRQYQTAFDSCGVDFEVPAS